MALASDSSSPVSSLTDLENLVFEQLQAVREDAARDRLAFEERLASLDAEVRVLQRDSAASQSRGNALASLLQRIFLALGDFLQAAGQRSL